MAEAWGNADPALSSVAVLRGCLCLFDMKKICQLAEHMDRAKELMRFGTQIVWKIMARSRNV